MVICFYREQVVLFQKAVRGCTVDINYKHISVLGEHEIIWVWFDPI